LPQVTTPSAARDAGTAKVIHLRLDDDWGYSYGLETHMETPMTPIKSMEFPNKNG